MSCSKNDEKTSPKTNLPNFGNVQLKNIFSDDTPKIKNKKHIVSLLNEYYQNIWGGAEMSGGFLVASGDEILIEKYKGFGRENEQMPINSATPLHIASVSKPITAMAILKLVEVDSLKLDQKINTIFPQFPYEEVSVFHLLSHRSGLPKYEYFLEKERLYPEQKFITNQEVLDFLIEKKPALARATDSGFMYCNTNYALLALIIEKITQKPFPQAMKEMLFEPLQMKNTFVFQEKDIEIATQSFYQKGHKLFPLNELDLVYGDKNIYTTPRDLLNFSKAMFSKDFLPKDLMEKVFQPYSNEKKGVNNYGLGFRMKFFDDNKKLTYHTGWWHGSNTIFIHLPNSKITIIALGNRYSRKVYSAMALSSLFEDFPFEIEKIITLGTPLEE
ncbi:MAG: serine hydrolase domain-containing protein [Flavobacteriaceae bacterium]|nr:serine hydrolase domain-containing protein [Flavobacteriaceae bacterium]